MIFFLLADKRSTHFTYIKIGRIAARYKSELPTGRLMIGCKCVLPCVVISYYETFFYRPTLLFMQDHSYTSIYYNKYLITAYSAYSGRRVYRSETYNTQIGCRRSLVLLRFLVRCFILPIGLFK